MWERPTPRGSQVHRSWASIPGELRLSRAQRGKAVLVIQCCRPDQRPPLVGHLESPPFLHRPHPESSSCLCPPVLWSSPQSPLPLSLLVRHKLSPLREPPSGKQISPQASHDCLTRKPVMTRNAQWDLSLSFACSQQSCLSVSSSLSQSRGAESSEAGAHGAGSPARHSWDAWQDPWRPGW